MKDFIIESFGTLFCDGSPIGPETAVSDGEIPAPEIGLEPINSLKFGNSGHGTPMPWFKMGSLWVSCYVYCLGVSWRELQRMGYIYGTPICIDGEKYLCRSMVLNNHGEWGRILKEYDILHDKHMKNASAFFGQDFVAGNGIFQEDRCSIAGDSSKPSLIRAVKVGVHNSEIGFRPVLEPIGPMPVVNSSMLGQSISLYCGAFRLDGTLMDYTDYDLVLKVEPNKVIDGQDLAGIAEHKDTVVVDREIILHMKENRM